MGDKFNSVKEYPDINFIEDLSFTDIQDGMVQDFIDKYKEVTGESIALGKADPSRLILSVCCTQIYQALQYIDRAGKQSFLKYAYGDYLDNLAALKGIKRIGETAAYVLIKFTLSHTQNFAVTIPKGTRVSTENNIYFATAEEKEIPIGDNEVVVQAECTESGTIGNEHLEGTINNLVDLVPFVESVQNMGTSGGGAEIEDDINFAERIFLAPSSYSVAGPGDAYVYWVKTFNPNISDVMVFSPSPGVVDIRIIEKDGLPSEGTIQKMQEDLSNNNIRPLTDKVQVSAPDVIDYKIEVKYWINESDKNLANFIKDKVDVAVSNYVLWQKEKIGRDINPSYLQSLIINAGAKRTELIEPGFVQISQISIANLTEKSIVYGGIEDD